MSKIFSRFAAFCALLAFTLHPASACTDFVVKAEDGCVVNARSMEWAADFHSELVVHPPHETVVSPAPNDSKGPTWTSKYGYVGINVGGINTSVDGMNENGLSFGLLWLPTYTKYQNIPAGQEATALELTALGAWLLGNFSTVDEVREAISKVRVWGADNPAFHGIPTAHLAVHDASGKNLVVEFIDGEQKIYDNQLGVLTNAPPFNWQIINLRNYFGLRAANPAPVDFKGKIYDSAGQGGGLLGIPGDWQPPSRFVRTSAIVHFSKPTTDAKEAVILSEHILNTVDIPIGVISDTINGVVCHDYTQWTVIKDMTNKKFYYRSYNDLTLRFIDLKTIDFAKLSERKSMPIEAKQPFEDTSASVQ